MNIVIPFRPEFKDRMLNRAKTTTCRTKQYGKRGDTFEIFGARFTIKEILPITLEQVAKEYFVEEGFGNPIEFIQCWNEIHPNKGYVPSQRVFLHKFTKLDEGEFIAARIPSI